MHMTIWYRYRQSPAASERILSIDIDTQQCVRIPAHHVLTDSGFKKTKIFTSLIEKNLVFYCFNIWFYDYQ